MAIEACYRHKGGHCYGPFYRVVTQQEGVRRRSYVSRGFAPILMLLADNRRRERAAARAERQQLRCRLKGKRPGRRPAISGLGRQLLVAAGYRCYGRRIAQNPHAWRDPAVMAARYDLLSPEWRQAIGSPQQLARLTREAWSRLHRANRHSVPGVTFGDAFLAAAELGSGEQGGS